MHEIIEKPKFAVFIVVVFVCGAANIFGPELHARFRNKRALLTRSSEERNGFEELWILDDDF